MSRDDESANSDLRRFALLDLFVRIIGEKLRCLEYVKEIDCDPTLEKVFLYSASISLREMAADLSALGHSHRAKYLLDARPNIRVSDALVLLDDTVLFLKDTYPGIGKAASDRVEACLSGSYRIEPLALFRARFLIATICDDQGRQALAEEDIPRLLSLPAARLDEMYVTAARLSQIPVFARPAEKDTATAKFPRASQNGRGEIIRPNAKRNAWVYQQFIGHPEKTVAAIRAEAKSKGWNMHNDPAAYRALESHCRSHGIDIPRRKNSRNKQD